MPLGLWKLATTFPVDTSMTLIVENPFSMVDVLWLVTLPIINICAPASLAFDIANSDGARFPPDTISVDSVLSAEP